MPLSTATPQAGQPPSRAGLGRILSISLGQDTGGWAARLRWAFERTSDVAFDAIVASETYIGYPRHRSYQPNEAQRLYDAADVVLHHNTLAAHDRHDRGQRKPAVLLHHGTIFRDHHAELAAAAHAAGALQIASTLDLTLLEPDVEWVPTPYDLVWLRQIRAEHYRPSPFIRIAHAPTNRAVKGTEAVIAAVERLARRHEIAFDLIERARWDECLVRKAQADIFVDQLVLGYGCNAVEAWGMGIPVIAGVADERVEAAMRQRWGDMPFAVANPETLEGVLEDLVRDELARRQVAELGWRHAERWHRDDLVVERILAVCERAIGGRPC